MVKKSNKIILALVPALIAFATAMVESSACQCGYGEPEIPKSLRK